MRLKLRAIRVLVRIECEEPIYDYTGRLTKQLAYTLNKEIRLFHSMKGMLAPITISPPFTRGKEDYQLGKPVIPQYENVIRGRCKETAPVPVKLGDEYLMHIGGVEELVQSLQNTLEKQRTRGALTIPFDGSLVTFKIEGIQDVTDIIMRKEVEEDWVTVYLKSPAMIFNVFATTRLPKFSPSAVEVLMTPFMYTIGSPTINHNVLIQASKTLGYLVETWYSSRTLKPIMIPFRKKKEVALTGRIKYIIDVPKNDRKVRDVIKQTLQTAEFIGIGESRLNGFGTITFSGSKT